MVDPDGPACGCGRRGCLSTFVTPSGLRRSAQVAMNGATPVSIQALAALARTDPRVRAVIDRAATYLAITLSSVVQLTDPELVILGGPATESLGTHFRAAVERRLASIRAPRLPAVAVEVSGLGADAGPVGAASMILHDILAPKIDRLLLASRS
jgi:predicted NBD/HSP70 family sugar kinase